MNMPISRRGFLGYAAGLSAIGTAGMSPWAAVAPRNRGSLSRIAVLDAGPACILRESADGYAAALDRASIRYVRCSIQSPPAARTVIVPAAALTRESSARRVRLLLDRGSSVLFESGGAFLGSEAFDSHRRLIQQAFGVRLGEPAGLWDSSGSSKQSPYVDYRWPLVTKTRDFSRIVPVDCTADETIAWFQDVPVAARRRVGKGTLVFLGSPLGPHLLAGDRESQKWFGAFCSCC